MKTRLLLSIVIILICAGAVLQGVLPVRYVSAWTFIPAGQTIAFEHGLGTRPLELDVWVIPFLNGSVHGACEVDFPAAIPAYESRAIHVQIVSLFSISVNNNADVGYCVQVVASP